MLNWRRRYFKIRISEVRPVARAAAIFIVCETQQLPCWSYGLAEDCERVVQSIRELIAEPNMSMLGGNDEEDAEKRMSAGQTKARRGAAVGRRGEKGAKPLVEY